MNGEQRDLPGADMAGFIREAADFVGFSEAEVAVIRRTAPLVLQHEPAIADALYEHFVNFPATARFFLLPDGTPDYQRLARRKHSLGRWLHETAEAALTHDFSYYLLAVGLSHSHRTYGPGGKIPPHLMVGAMSLVQTACTRIFHQELADPKQILEATVAWNKLLLVQLDVLLLGYWLHPHQG
jgi:hypothetical protein